MSCFRSQYRRSSKLFGRFKSDIERRYIKPPGIVCGSGGLDVSDTFGEFNSPGTGRGCCRRQQRVFRRCAAPRCGRYTHRARRRCSAHGSIRKTGGAVPPVAAGFDKGIIIGGDDRAVRRQTHDQGIAVQCDIRERGPVARLARGLCRLVPVCDPAEMPVIM